MSKLSDHKILGLTVHSPWAELIAQGDKTVECRSWAPFEFMLGRYVAIHASTRWDQEGYEFLRRNPQRFRVDPPRAEWCKHGVIAVARLVGWVRRPELGAPGGPLVVQMLPGHSFTEADWRWFHQSEFGWVLRSVKRIRPIEMKGRQGLWALPPPVYEAVRRRYTRAA